MMSLIDAMMDDCVIMNKVKADDGEGGLVTRWEEGTHIKAAITFDTSMQARVANQEGVSSTFTITTNKNVVLDYHDVIKRLSDGDTFRVTSDGHDKLSPAVSTLDISQVTAEKWGLTT